MLQERILVWTWRCLDCGEVQDNHRNTPPVHCIVLWCASPNFNFEGLHSEDPVPEMPDVDEVVEFQEEISVCAICQHEVSPDDAECATCGMPLGMPLAPN